MDGYVRPGRETRVGQDYEVSPSLVANAWEFVWMVKAHQRWSTWLPSLTSAVKAVFQPPQVLSFTCLQLYLPVCLLRCLSCYCCDRCDITGHPPPPTGKCPPACLSACLWLLSSFAALLDHQPCKEDFWPWRPQNDTCWGPETHGTHSPTC